MWKERELRENGIKRDRDGEMEMGWEWEGSFEASQRRGERERERKEERVTHSFTVPALQAPVHIFFRFIILSVDLLVYTSKIDPKGDLGSYFKVILNHRPAEQFVQVII